MPQVDYDKLEVAILKHSNRFDYNRIGLFNLSDFIGEPAMSPVVVEQELLSEGFPLGASVSQKVKKQNLVNEFIDLRSILSVREDPLSITVSTGVINLHQDSKSKNPISTAHWTDAFLVYSAIYLEKYPTEAPHLLKYCHTVREKRRLHGDAAFRTYDERFRKLKESRNVSWQKPISKLMIKAATLTKQFQSKPQKTALSDQILLPV